MSDMTREEYAERVLIALGNWPESHPVIAADIHLDAINNAPNRLIFENPDLFPEHHNRTWTYGATVVGSNRVESAFVPSNLWILQWVTHSGDAVPAGSPPSDWSSITETPVTMPPDAYRLIAYQAKGSDATGYPSIITRKDGDMMYWPTTRTGWTTYLHMGGISRELELADDDDTFNMDRHYDTVIVLVAASEVAEQAKLYALSDELLNRATTRLGRPIGAATGQNSVLARERANRRVSVKIAGSPF